MPRKNSGNQQQEIFSRILPKMAPVIVKYSQDNGFGMIIDTSKQWPQGPCPDGGRGAGHHQAVVDIYNAQSGVAAPAPGAAKPAAPKPTRARELRSPRHPSQPNHETVKRHLRTPLVSEKFQQAA